MICRGCSEVSRINRELSNLAKKLNKSPGSFKKHPSNCGCECMHKLPQEWAKMFSTEEPREEA